MNIKLTHKSPLQVLWPWHQASVWERFEPLWFSLIAIATVSIVAIGLRVVISHQLVGEERLYVSPSSYSVESADFFDSENDEVAFDPFIIPVARAQNDADDINIIIK